MPVGRAGGPGGVVRGVDELWWWGVGTYQSQRGVLHARKRCGGGCRRGKGPWGGIYISLRVLVYVYACS